MLRYLAHVTGEQNLHEFVFPLQLAGNQREGRGRVGAVSLLLATNNTEKLSKRSTNR